jgi:hypothetical protein
MRLANLTFPTRQFFERNTTYPHQVFVAFNVAPHTLTTRFTYTVPAGRFAYVHYAVAHCVRVVAATAANECGIQILLVTPSGQNLYLVMLRFTDNTLNVWRTQSISTQIIIPEQWTVRGETFDSSTGGQLNYFMNIGISEFSG